MLFVDNYCLFLNINLILHSNIHKSLKSKNIIKLNRDYRFIVYVEWILSYLDVYSFCVPSCRLITSSITWHVIGMAPILLTDNIPFQFVHVLKTLSNHDGLYAIYFYVIDIYCNCKYKIVIYSMMKDKAYVFKHIVD